MPRFEEISVTLPGGYQAYARLWLPARPRGAVLYHHGIQSHCGWYGASAARLAEAGYAVLQVDRRGSGRNLEGRGHAESAGQLFGDVLAARDELTRRSGFREHHVVGVSWGGKLAVASYVNEPAGVKSLSLVTPGLFPLVGVSKQQMAKIGFAMLYEPHRLFDIPLNEADLFTTVPRWQQFFNTDKPTLRQCTAGFYLASRRMDKIVARFPRARPVSVHLFVAGNERIIDNHKTTSFIRDLHWPHSRITTYADVRHSLEFESDSEAYFQDLVSFINEV
ncbi:MAG: alpha/beta fold hydrolase [Phycisphaerales bacterium]|nr:MAG: alpha/beta fold hydrolase [Phycisphaerales bacterium]